MDSHIVWYCQQTPLHAWVLRYHNLNKKHYFCLLISSTWEILKLFPPGTFSCPLGCRRFSGSFGCISGRISGKTWTNSLSAELYEYTYIVIRTLCLLHNTWKSLQPSQHSNAVLFDNAHNPRVEGETAEWRMLLSSDINPSKWFAITIPDSNAASSPSSKYRKYNPCRQNGEEKWSPVNDHRVWGSFVSIPARLLLTAPTAQQWSFFFWSSALTLLSVFIVPSSFSGISKDCNKNFTPD